jgi:hypothetical protein
MYAGMRFGMIVITTNQGVFNTSPLTCTGQGPQAVISPGVVSTVVPSSSIPATLINPSAVRLDTVGNGNVYFAESGNDVVRLLNRAVTPNQLSIIAGTPGTPATATSISNEPGPASSSQLNGPSALGLDAYNDIFIADTNDNLIQVVCTVSVGPFCTEYLAGKMGIAVGGNVSGFTCSGAATAIPPNADVNIGDGCMPRYVALNGPKGVALDTNGSVYMADTGDHSIRWYNLGSTSDGNVYTVAGTGPSGACSGTCGDGGPALNAQLNGPQGIAVDPYGNVFIADTGNNRVRVICREVTNARSATAAAS